MRKLLGITSLIVLLAAPALAQDIDVIPPEGAGASAQHQLPSAVANPPGSTPSTKPNVAAMPVKSAVAPVTSTSSSPTEPNMKITKDSGGRTDSYLIKDAPLPSDFVLGKVTAPIVMIEYASMSCPHCAHFSNTVLPELEKRYIDTGKMRYVLRQFPLNEPALKAAELLDCVGEQDKAKYFVFAKVLFDAQSKWAFDGNYMAGLETIAQVGGMSKEQFQACVTSTDREMKVLKAKKLTNDELQLPHTPFIYIGGEVYSGDRSIEAMSAFIDAKLAQSPRH